MSAATILAEWRAELETEMAEAQIALATARDELADATAAASEATRQRREILDVFARRDRRRPTPGSLARRLEGYTGMRPADGRLAMAESRLESARLLVIDLSEALAELARSHRRWRWRMHELLATPRSFGGRSEGAWAAAPWRRPSFSLPRRPRETDG